MTLMTVVATVTVTVRTVLMMTLRSLCGVKQLQASLQANAPTSTVPNAVSVGMMIKAAWIIVARMKLSISTVTSAIAKG